VTDPIAQGVFVGLLVGKTVGVLGGTWLAVRLGLGRLPEGVGWADVLPVAVLGGIGYTVSLLVTELAFTDPDARERAAGSVLAASLVASIVALVLLRRRTRRSRA
jgi:Na+:H+ antiporter, NhaA family